MTNIKNGSLPGKVTPNKKAAGGIKSTTATNSISQIDHIAKGATQLDLDLDHQHTTAVVPPAARPVQPCLTRKQLLPNKPRTKLETILGLFVNGLNMNRFEAENHYDHCLHSTVSTLQNNYVIKIARQSETVACLRGRSSVRCMRYWLETSPENIAAARALLVMLEKRA